MKRKSFPLSLSDAHAQFVAAILINAKHCDFWLVNSMAGLYYFEVCELHFCNEDFIVTASAFDGKTGKVVSAPLQRKRLKPGACPSIFNGPTSSKKHVPRRDAPNDKREEREQQQLQEAIKLSIQADQEYREEISISKRSDENFLAYISNRVTFLNDSEKVVALLLDEIHIAPFFDYKSGNVVGNAYDSVLAANSAFVFMVSNLTSSFVEARYLGQYGRRK
ncbi:hypothetical protein JTE90_008889 [Oedothorax gibbosus]|uniref:Uncharacterized protein n=1 Tax=Oedothorax gibbosus TaxID=931172 RepID=A0AAV6TV91_9ARAC|nr:hypothetical protein JTE90_008889 [Oedothorax gibbosus]